ncbi:MAG: glutaredoxin 3 [Methylococcales bacterium]|nr:glutaredoxin 3 [Methylococcales bacterium]
MQKILIYSSNRCPFCTMAKRLLEQRGLNYSEINVDSEPHLREEMMKKTNRRTVPQIYIGDYHVGGFNELHALDQSKKLDALLVTDSKN